jgi:hypothetical protein
METRGSSKANRASADFNALTALAVSKGTGRRLVRTARLRLAIHIDCRETLAAILGANFLVTFLVCELSWYELSWHELSCGTNFDTVKTWLIVWMSAGNPVTKFKTTGLVPVV